MTKVEAKKTGKIRRTNPVVQPEFSADEDLLRSFSRSTCNKCNGTGRKKILIIGFSRILVPCKCVSTSLWWYEERILGPQYSWSPNSFKK